MKTDGGGGVAKRVHELKSVVVWAGKEERETEREREGGGSWGRRCSTSSIICNKHIFNFKAAKTCCKY